MGVTVTNYIQDGPNVIKRVHELNHFPSFDDMAVFCKRDAIFATDFEHISRSADGTFYVGRFLVPGGTSGSGSHQKRRGLRFLVRCDEKPTYEELVR